MNKLTGAQKRFLKGEAHHLKPLAQVGKQGVTPAFVKEVEALLFRHELIKVKFNEFKDEKKELFQELVKSVKGHSISMIGNTGIIFKQNPDEDQQVYEL